MLYQKGTTPSIADQAAKYLQAHNHWRETLSYGLTDRLASWTYGQLADHINDLTGALNDQQCHQNDQDLIRLIRGHLDFLRYELAEVETFAAAIGENHLNPTPENLQRVTELASNVKHTASNYSTHPDYKWATR